ncbi:peptidoglycan-binding domain-containing protein [Nonomuraea sp. NPDC046570]|uniref:peptidoglycan-binding domain-containing protein n=1 Tax=Nonomuraea sp. NPDC046570 TaxID=3155255 RepID=UPI0034099040
MKSPRKVLAGTVAGVIAVAGLGWGVSTRLRSPADEAALRKAPTPSLVTAAVERRKLTSSVVVSGTLEYGSPRPVALAGVVGGTAEAQRATRAPRAGRLREGAVLMEVNGRPVFTLKGSVPMHRTMAPGTKGKDVLQLQRALRRLGFGGAVTGVFDQTTVAAVRRWYDKRGYQAQEPDLTARQSRDTLRKAVQTAEETLALEERTLEQGLDVAPLKVKLDNARDDLKAAESALEEAEAVEVPPEDARALEDLRRAVRSAQEELASAEAALAAAKPEDAKAPLELKVRNARANLSGAQDAISAFLEEARVKRGKNLEDLRKAVRTAQDTVLTADQALRHAKQTSPVKLKVSNAKKDVAAAKALLGEFLQTYGTTIPPGEIVFLPRLPARVQKVKIKAGATVADEVATVTSSSFVVSGSVEAAEADLLRAGMPATIETTAGKIHPARLTSVGDALPGSSVPSGSEGVLLTPVSDKGLKGMAGAAVTVKITVGATSGEVLVVPVAAVVTAADGKPRVKVEVAPDKTKEVEVRTGLAADGDVQVTGDLEEGDRVVVGGA